MNDLPVGRGRKATLAKAWSVSQSYIGQLVKKNGMPLDSFQTTAEATAWRERHAMRRASPMSKQARAVKSARVSARTPPDDSEDQAPPPQERRGDGSLEDALAGTVTVADEAMALVREAIRNKDRADIPVFLSIHNKAREQQFKAQRQYREEMEHRKQLVPYAAAVEEFRRGVKFILARLDRLPEQQAPRCNPSNPLLALEILKVAVMSIREDVSREYAPV